jgi:3-hydroxyisobutyrate dehydrogenase-like beta-hydroxyacid dehydrogenase
VAGAPVGDQGGIEVVAGTRQQTVGVVGLGPLGLTIARGLATHRPVIAYDGSAGPREHARAAGIEVLDDLVPLARSCNTVVLSLPTADEVAAAVSGLAPYAPGLLLLDTSIIEPQEARRIAAAALADGSTYLDVPVHGRPDEAGTWTVPMGGPAAAYGAVAALLEPLASRVVRMGEVGDASAWAARGTPYL